MESPGIEDIRESQGIEDIRESQGIEDIGGKVGEFCWCSEKNSMNYLMLQLLL